MNLNRIDSTLDRHFNPHAFERKGIPSSHEVAALLDQESSKEILREIPAIGPVTYLSKLGILISNVEKDGYDFLLEQRGVFGIADAEATCGMPNPKVLESMKSHSSRDIMRGVSSLFDIYEGKGVTIGVMDSGIDASHPEFSGRCQTQVNCVGDSLSGDVNGHGTHVAGSIIGESIGVASEAEIIDLRVFGRNPGASISNILMALDHCVSRNVDIVNMSLGSTESSFVLESAVNQVANNDILVCVAAGNSGPNSGTIGCPSSAQLAISVAATNASKHVAEFSSRGPCLWNSWQKPDCAGFGENVHSSKNGGGYTVMSGTSMATPGVVGVAACLLEYQKEESGTPTFVDWLMRNAGVTLNQKPEEVGCGFISLNDVENYVGNKDEMGRMASKKKGIHVSKKFFKNLLKCSSCQATRAIHQIRHRMDGTMVFVLSCLSCRKQNLDGKLDFDDVVLEEWQHKRILSQEILKALRRCGKCGKAGLVILGDWDKLKVKTGHFEHSEGKVGCLYCQGKGLRKIPSRFADLWTE